MQTEVCNFILADMRYFVTTAKVVVGSENGYVAVSGKVRFTCFFIDYFRCKIVQYKK